MSRMDALKMSRVTINTKKLAVDMLINLVGTAISLSVLQLLIYPMVARVLAAEEYGQMQSIVSVVYLFSGTLGTGLCTTRLVREYEYRDRNIASDFNLFSVICMTVIIIGMPAALPLYARDLSNIDILLITVVSILNFTSNYYSVGLRLNIDYKAVFSSKVLGSLGYIVGFVFFYYTSLWQCILICSFLFETVYYYIKTNLFYEPIKKSIYFNITRKTFTNLAVSNLLSRAITYFDKLLLYPLLGGGAVSVYVTANVFGKLILMTIEPITNVILSYLSKHKKVSLKIWMSTIPVSLAACTIMYFVCIIVSEPVLRFFYPQWADEAMILVPLTTLCLAISAFINIMYPFTLKTIKSNRQIIINCIGLFSYIFFVIIIYKPFGLKGCCIALIISYILKLIAIFAFCFGGLVNDKRKTHEE